MKGESLCLTRDIEIKMKWDCSNKRYNCDFSESFLPWSNTTESLESMADAFLNVLLDGFTGALGDGFIGAVRLLTGVRDDTETLKNKLRRIQAHFNDAEGREMTEEAVRLWLKDVKCITYDAADVIDEFKAMVEDENSIIAENRVRFTFSLPFRLLKQVPRRYKTGKRVREISEEIDDVLEEGSKLGLREGVGKKLRIATGERPQTHSFVDESEIYGRDEDKNAIVDKLLDNGSATLEKDDLSVIPIVGLGGLGKTTLAQLAYNDERVAEEFEEKIWVCVSVEFDEKRVIKSMIESITNKHPDLLELDPLASHLQEVLKPKKYRRVPSPKKFLLVLDDVWDDDSEKWNRMRTLLRSCGRKGSSIIVTTRNENVARIMGTTNSYNLRVLSDDDCWSVFKQRAFGRESENVPPYLVQIGKEIVRKCKGVPLAAQALGSMMRNKEENYWRYIRDCEIWNLSEDQNGILPALRLSYDDLPSHLKRCFEYCSIFPKNYLIEKETLIQLWMAEGFIQSSSDGCRLAEDVGNEYFNDLLWRSFFQSVQKDKLGNILYCKMHDLIHDLAQSIAKDSCLILDINNDQQRISNQARHLSLVDGSNGGDDATMPMPLDGAKSLHTLLILHPYSKLKFTGEVVDKMFLSFRLLRVLTLSCLGGNNFELPTSIGDLIHLRYLDISLTRIDNLPRSFFKLKNLQTLKLSASLSELPQELSSLKNLRHLYIAANCWLTRMPSKIGELSSLQTLPRFIVSKDSRCGIAELQSLNLRGSIKIENLENVANVADARRANLKGKHSLQKLGLLWSNSTSMGNIEEVLEGLQPPQNLKTLFVKNYNGVKFSTWLMDLMLPNLVRIGLFNCPNCDLLPPFGSLPSLEVLVLREIHGVKCLEIVKSRTDKGFPSLKKLHLCSMPKLEELLHTHGNGFFPCLEELRISCCPKLTSLPRLSALKKLTLDQSNSMMLNSVTSLTSLSLLEICGFQELKFLPERMLQPLNLLWRLEIRGCPKLRSLPSELENLTSLKELAIIECSELECLPEELYYLTLLKCLAINGCNSLSSFPDKAIQGLTALRNLRIQRCPKLRCLHSRFRNLTSLQHLTICDVGELNTLPDDLQHLTNLEILELEELDRFTSLPEWLGNLTSLQSLFICNLRNLTSLPKRLGNLTSLQSLTISDLRNLTSLPAGMQHLSSLRYLDILSCPHLEERCRKDIGEDWPKIQHIPSFNFNLHARIMCGRSHIERVVSYDNFYVGPLL